MVHMSQPEDLTFPPVEKKTDCSAAPPQLMADSLLGESSRRFAAALLGHSLGTNNETMCNFRVTHLPSGFSWGIKRPLAQWIALEEDLMWEAEAGGRPIRKSAGAQALDFLNPAGFWGEGSSEQPLRASHRRQAMLQEPMDSIRRQKQLDALQAKLCNQLASNWFRASAVLHNFLGVRPPEVPSVVRIADLRASSMRATAAQEAAEVTLQMSTADSTGFHSDIFSLPTHIELHVALIKPSPDGTLEDSETFVEHILPVGTPSFLTVRGLSISSIYEFQVCSANEVGRSEYIRIRVLIPGHLPHEYQAAGKTDAEQAVATHPQATQSEQSRDSSELETSKHMTSSGFAPNPSASSENLEDEEHHAHLPNNELSAEQIAQSRRLEETSSSALKETQSLDVQDCEQQKQLLEDYVHHAQGQKNQPDGQEHVSQPLKSTATRQDRQQHSHHRDQIHELEQDQQEEQEQQPGIDLQDRSTEIRADSAVYMQNIHGSLQETSDAHSCSESNHEPSIRIRSLEVASVCRSEIVQPVHESVKTPDLEHDTQPLLDQQLQRPVSQDSRNMQLTVDTLGPTCFSLEATTVNIMSDLQPSDLRDQQSVEEPQNAHICDCISQHSELRIDAEHSPCPNDLLHTRKPERRSGEPETAPCLDVQPDAQGLLGLPATHQLDEQESQRFEQLREQPGGTLDTDTFDSSSVDVPLAVSVETGYVQLNSDLQPAHLLKDSTSQSDAPSTAAMLGDKVLEPREQPAPVSACMEILPKEPSCEHHSEGLAPEQQPQAHQAELDRVHNSQRDHRQQITKEQSRQVEVSTLDVEQPGKHPGQASLQKTHEQSVPHLQVKTECQQHQERIFENNPSPGFVRVGSLEIREQQVTDAKSLGSDLDRAVQSFQAQHQISEQLAVRLLLGCDFDEELAAKRLIGILRWRKQNQLDELRARLLAELRVVGERGPFPVYHQEVGELVIVNPCALTCMDGSPVTIWHVGTAKSAAAGKAVSSHLSKWSQSVYEYVDIWISQQTDQTRRMMGHVQIFDLNNVGFWQASSSALLDKLKILLSAGGNYMEAVSHIFVVNSSSVFSIGWKLAKGLVSPRTEAKINVSNAIPEELNTLLGPNSAKMLLDLSKNPQWSAGVQRSQIMAMG